MVLIIFGFFGAVTIYGLKSDEFRLLPINASFHLFSKKLKKLVFSGCKIHQDARCGNAHKKRDFFLLQKNGAMQTSLIIHFDKNKSKQKSFGSRKSMYVIQIIYFVLFFSVPLQLRTLGVLTNMTLIGHKQGGVAPFKVSSS